MGERTELAAGGRRTQAGRTAETRGRIIAAVLESVSEVGFQRTTANEITRRAGVTWGAVQHHFGGKDGMLVAVLEASFEHFAAQLEDIPSQGLSLEERANRFIDGAWAHFSSSQYRCTFEILLNGGVRSAGSSATSWQAEMFRSWDRIWRRIFHDSELTRRQHVLLGHYTVATLSGLASTLMLEGEGAKLQRAELDFLKGLLARELSRHRGSVPPR